MKRLLIVLTICLVAGPAAAQLSLLGLKNSMVQFLLDQISVEGQFEVTAGRVEEPEDGVTAITDLAIADSQGVWFRAKSLNFSWSPARLLLGEIEFSNLALTDVDVLRQPVPAPAAEEPADEDAEESDADASPFDWPRSPLALKIERMALEDVSVDQAVLGHAIEFDATGSAQDEGDIQAVALNLKRLDAVEGVINFNYARNFSDNTLSLHLDAREGPNGMISDLGGLPPEASTTAEIDASGPPDDWKMTLAIALADTLDLNGRADISYAGPLKVDAELTARPGPLMAPNLAAVLGTEAQLIARASEGPDGLILIEEGHLKAPDLDLIASGSYARPTGAADLKIDLAARPGLSAAVPGVEFGGLAFVGTVKGAPGNIAAKGDLDLMGVLTQPADIGGANLVIDVAQSTPEVDDAPTTTTFSVSGGTEGLRLDKLGPDVLGDPDLRLAGELVDTALTLETLSLTSKVVELAVSGTADLDTQDADLTLSLAAPDLGPIAAAYDQAVTGAIDAKGTATRKDGVLDADLTTRFQNFSHEMADAADLALTLTVQNEGARTDFDLSGTGTRMRIDKLTPEILGDPTFATKGTLDGDALTLEALDLDSRPLRLNASGTADLATQDADIAFRLAAPDMGPAALAYDQIVEGAIQAEGSVKRAGEATELSLVASLTGLVQEFVDAASLELRADVTNEGERTAFDLEGTGEEMRIDKIPPGLLGIVAFETKGVLDADALSLEPSTIRTDILTAKASGDLDIAESSGEILYDLSTGSLAPITELYDVALDGKAAVNGKVVMESGVPTIIGTAALSEIVFDGTSYGDLALDHDVSVGEAPEGTLQAKLSDSPYGDATASTRFVFAAPELTLSEFDAKALGLAVKGDLALDTESTLAEGKLTLASGSLKPLSGLAGAELGGALNGQVTLSRPEGRQNAVATLKATDLSADKARIAAVDLSARLSNLLGTPGIDTDLVVDGIEAGDLEVARFSATAQGPLTGIAVTASATGKVKKDEINLALAAKADAAGPQYGATISRFDMGYGEETLALNQPMTIRAQGARVVVEGIDIALPRGGALVGDIDKYGNGMKGAIRLSNLDAGLARRFAGAPILGGTVSADATFDTGRGPANVTLAIDELQFEGVDTGNTMSLEANADWDGRIANASGQLVGDFGQPLTFSAELPLRPGLIPTPASRGPIDARLDWEGEIGKIWAMVPAAGHFLTGKAEVHLGITGDISDPKISGDMGITDGGYQNLDAGTILTDLTLDTQITPEGALTFELDAKDAGAGTITTRGEVALDQSGIEIRTVIDKAVLVRRDDVTARVDSNIDVIGPIDALDVTGEIVLETVEVRLVSNASAGIVDLGDVIIKGEEEEEEDQAESSVNLDLKITSPGRVFVRGRGLDSTWGVDLAVQGTAAQPLLTGNVEKVRGLLLLIGKTFDLTRGRIDFDGTPKIDPRLDIVFERETPDLTGRIVISGKSSDPKLNFTSSPSLPEDEVLPMTIFGKSSQALTGSQAIQLALGVATLMDGGGGTLDKVRGAIGLDALRVEEDDEGNTAVAAGKEVAPGVYVGVKQGLTGGDSKAVVEIDVFKDISVDAEVGIESGPTVGLRWKHDF